VPPFDWSEVARSSQVTAQFKHVDWRFEQIDARFEIVEQRLSILDGRVARLEVRLDQVGSRLDRLDDGHSGVRDELRSMSRTIAVGAVGFTLSMVLATATMVATIVLSGALG
jgi:hypothetical protein